MSLPRTLRGGAAARHASHSLVFDITWKSSSARHHSCLWSRCIVGSEKTTQARPDDPSILPLQAASTCSCCCRRPVGGTVSSSHATVAPYPLRTSLRACLLACKRICVVTASQIELTRDSPVFDGKSMIAQSSDFSPSPATLIAKLVGATRLPIGW